MRVQKIVFLILCFIAAIILLRTNKPNLFTLFCSFLPAIISILFDDIEKINLICARIAVMNKTVSTKISVKNIFLVKCKDNDVLFYEEKLKDVLLNHGVTVGRENNILRIEGSQKVSYGKDKNFVIRVPVLVYIQLQDNQVIVTLRNSSESIAYRDLYNIIRSLETTWDFINENIKDICRCKQQAAFYEARVRFDSNKFKNVYLKSYSQKAIKNIEITKEDVKIKFDERSMIITSASEQKFEKTIRKYNGLFSSFFKEEG